MNYIDISLPSCHNIIMNSTESLVLLRDYLWELRYDYMKSNRSNDGMTGSALYNTWLGMLDRCYNPNSYGFSIYGARGISVCERWLSLKNFISGMGNNCGLTLDRIDGDKDYSLDNCRRTSRKGQMVTIRPEIKEESKKRYSKIMKRCFA